MNTIETKTYIDKNGKERRVFCIDVGDMPLAKAEALYERIKTQFQAKKEANKIEVEDQCPKLE